MILEKPNDTFMVSTIESEVLILFVRCFMAYYCHFQFF